MKSTLTYIVGTRRSGKTTKLKDSIIEKTTWISPNLAMLKQISRELIKDKRGVKLICFPVFLSTFSASRILVDEFQLLSHKDQDTLLQYCDKMGIELVVSITPEAIDFNRLPPYVLNWHKAHVISLTPADLHYAGLYDSMSFEAYTTQFKGVFIYKGV